MYNLFDESEIDVVSNGNTLGIIKYSNGKFKLSMPKVGFKLDTIHKTFSSAANLAIEVLSTKKDGFKKKPPYKNIYLDYITSGEQTQ